MPIDRFVGIIAATVGFFGAVFVLIGSFRLSSDLIARLAATPYGGFSMERLKSLSKQKAYLASGVVLVFLAFVFQISPFVFIQEPWQILGNHNELAAYLAMALGIILVLLVYRLEVMFSRYTEGRAKRAVLKGRLERALKQNPVGRAYLNSTVEGADSLLGITRGQHETVTEFLRRLAGELRVPFPPDLRIED